ncbi:uncharacterized protein LACBIDRAFT_180968 [Laccaria bicolor S238N-H82]|uniref:Predicted protein n=1 Tax=Laccaria bicolor (strain S238N-H82 / ATCC MYA-4686) TaxID=486041 RepID=B0E0Y3_LACBS|nr:uncharacterized protein LACBIDRAFT_180968 [Laccaria bicolor S238N-H82]EDQ99483.1 predicted protein [Laccaria bicolor S238N-H82]|eukprot:XP_001889832.1 predicted protein [Laccaria bicolor S238N-H82]
MSSSSTTTNRHALTAVEKQRYQLEKLLKDPAKPAYVPPPPKDKTLRPAREMMKNVQGSSAGAGSGEFHVYKASRRREYERLKMLEEESLKETVEAEFERKKREAEGISNAKTAKNRAKRQKKKERSKTKSDGNTKEGDESRPDAPIKKRRLVNGKELVFKRPGEESDDDNDEQQPGPSSAPPRSPSPAPPVAMAETTKITIHEM